MLVLLLVLIVDGGFCRFHDVVVTDVVVVVAVVAIVIVDAGAVT